MFATLAGKALVPVGLAVTGFMVVCCLLLYSAIRDDLHRAEVLHATSLADTVLKSTRYAMLKDDSETLATIVHNVGEQKGVDHVRIFNKKGVVNISANSGEIKRQIDKKAEGCIVCHKGAVPVTNLGTMEQSRTFRNAEGRDVMAITAPIYNEPECFNAACHVHSSSQKILGTLDIGLYRDELTQSLSHLRTQMIVFTLMCLVLTVGGVTALLRRNVFLPIRKLRNYVEQPVDKEDIHTPPPHLPRDLDRIAASYYNIRQKLSKTAHNTGEPGNETNCK